MSPVLFEVATTDSGSISPPPAVIPLRFTVCSPASSGTGAGSGIASSVGGSSTGFTVNRNESDAVSVVPPEVNDAVTVMVAVPDRSGAGVTLSVRVEPLPVMLRLAFGTSTVLPDVAVTTIPLVPSPTLNANDNGVSSFVEWSAMSSIVGFASTAPMSTVWTASGSAESRMRAKPVPRWSVIGVASVNGGDTTNELSPASIAGLPVSSARVWVGQPLSASGPSLGSIGGRAGPTGFPRISSAMPVRLVPSPIRLLADTGSMAPMMSDVVIGPVPDVFPATIVLRRMTVTPGSTRMPPARRPSAEATLPATVALVIVAEAVPSVATPPPVSADVLPLTVVFVIVSVAVPPPSPNASTPPPSSTDAVLPLIVLSTIVSEAELLAARVTMPPPVPAVLPATATAVAVTVVLPSAKTPPPKPSRAVPFARPLVIVTPLTANDRPELTWKMRKAPALASRAIDSVFAPGPLMTTLRTGVSSAVVSVIGLVTEF